jgi:hypothetical protein
MKAFTTKLIDLTQKNAETIARQWAKDVKTNAKTYTYHEASEDKIILQAKDFYSNFHMNRRKRFSKSTRRKDTRREFPCMKRCMP